MKYRCQDLRRRTEQVDTQAMGLAHLGAPRAGIRLMSLIASSTISPRDKSTDMVTLSTREHLLRLEIPMTTTILLRITKLLGLRGCWEMVDSAALDTGGDEIVGSSRRGEWWTSWLSTRLDYGSTYLLLFAGKQR